MPNRILREGINSSRAVAALSEQAEILYRRLMSVVDDYGRFEADIDLIRAKCFPLQLERWSTVKVQRAFAELGESPLVTVYHGAGKHLFQMNNFGQRVQSKPRYPAPEDCIENKGEPSSTVDHGEPRESTAQSETYSETKTKSKAGTVAVMPRRFARGPMPAEWIQEAMQKFGMTEAAARFEYDKFTDYWCARGDKGAIKTDWLATWRNWLRKCDGGYPPRGTIQPGMLPLSELPGHMNPGLLTD